MLIRLSENARLYHADCRDAIKSLPDNSIDSCVTDPPYGLQFMGAEWDKLWRDRTDVDKAWRDAHEGTLAARARKLPDYSTMSKGADMQANHLEWAKEVFRVLKPGGFIAAFSASRTYHRMACAIEDAGFEMRDSLMWLYAVGFPKSRNVSRDDVFCQCEPTSECDVRFMQRADVSQTEHVGAECGQVLQSGMSQHGASASGRAQSADNARPNKPGMEGRRDIPPSAGQLRSGEICSLPAGPDNDGPQGRVCDGAPLGDGSQDWAHTDTDGMRPPSRSQSAAQRRNQPRTVAGQSQSQNGRAWETCGRCCKPMVPDGFGTALKPAFEPIVLARKPLSESTVAANVLRWGTGALNIGACRVGMGAADRAAYEEKRRSFAGVEGKVCGADVSMNASKLLSPEQLIANSAQGRWPANVVHDGSDEVVGAFPRAKGAVSNGSKTQEGHCGTDTFKIRAREQKPGYADDGSAARFFYSAKASRADRNGSKHPTVKPIALMQWLARLITPPGGTVLDPFAGSGTTGAAAEREGFGVVLCEREDEYVADIRNRFGTPPAPSPLARLLRWNAAVTSYRAKVAA